MSAKNNLTQDIIIIFLVTAFFFFFFRLLSEDKIKFFVIDNIKWITVL